MKIKMTLGLTLSLVLGLLCNQASANQNIYQDVNNDASDRADKPTRIKLKKEPSLSLGRFAGIWGSVGHTDSLDAFFFGKTAGKARLRVTLTAAPDMPPVTLKISAQDGQNIRTEVLKPKAGETLETWVRLKGKIQLDITPESREKSYYALYVWYPGDRFDGLSQSEFNALQNGEAPDRPSFVRQLKRPDSEGK